MHKIALLSLLLLSQFGWAQSSQAPYHSLVTPKDIIVCYGSDKSMHTNIPPPKAYLSSLARGRVQRSTTANFEVKYYGFSQEAQRAFQKAVDIWSTLITSDITIKIEAVWKPLKEGVLGSCGPATLHKNFPGAQRENVYYPAALANKMAKTDLDKNESDILAEFSSSVTWHYDPDTSPPSGKTDLVSVVLHEIGHGLGILSSLSVNSTGTGIVSSSFEGNPSPYDLFLEAGSGTALLSYTPPSRDLGTVLTGNALYFKSPIVTKNFKGRGKMYAPTTYNSGSSLSHNDEDAYPAGNANSLMTPQLAYAERIHDPGPLTMGELIDMGWGNPVLIHTKVVNNDSKAIDTEVVCKLTSGDAGYPPLLSTLTLYYIKNNEAPVSVAMTASGTANEYKATIPKPLPSDAGTVNYAYYIAVEDENSRTFTWPGKRVKFGTTTAEQLYYKFTAGAISTKSPLVYHTAKTRVRSLDASLEIVATFSHDYGIQGGFVDWQINENAQTRVPFEFVSDSTYKAILPLSNLNLTGTDIIKYRLSATDNSSVHRATVKPSESTFYSVNVTAYKPAQESYVNNFNNLKSDDFYGDFTIAQAENFTNGAIQSPHPYEEAQKSGKTSINYTYELLRLIKVKEGMGDVRFDEVVLVEPGEKNAVFGSQEFYDYVVVEGSTDKGITWNPLADGWDSGSYSDWNTAWTNQKNGSAKKGDPALYRRRTLNLLDNFKPNEEVILRFRLYSDQQLAGWGWTIDNLAIQEKDFILHSHLDYVISGVSTVKLPEIQVLDVNTIRDLSLEYKVNNGEINTYNFTLDKNYNSYQLDLKAENALKKGTYIDYRIKAVNSDNQDFTLPRTRDYFRIEVLDLNESPVSFDKITTDMFIGNFITATKEKIETEHPYALGFGLNYKSDFSAILSKPVKIETKRPNFTFKEKLALGANDSVQVEGSGDGISWKPLINKYTNEATDVRTGDFFKDNNFKAGDVILLRFRLSSSRTDAGRGWEISNLQFKEVAVSQVAAVEEEKEFSLFPNPVKEGEITVWVNAVNDFSAQVIDIYGRQILTQYFPGGTKEIKLSTKNLSAGLYVLYLVEGEKRRTLRFVKL